MFPSRDGSQSLTSSQVNRGMISRLFGVLREKVDYFIIFILCLNQRASYSFVKVSCFASSEH